MTSWPIAATVLDASVLTPRMRRITVGGPEIARLRTPLGALGPYFKLHLTARNGRELVRTYSIRYLDEARRAMTFDILVHGDQGAGSRFAQTARPGDPVLLAGPGHIPAKPARTYLLAGDHTALPAIAHILENLPSGPAVRAILEVPDADEGQPLPARSGIEVIWLHRRPGARSALAEAVRAATDGRPDGLLLWAGAEAAIARAIRAHARTALGLPAARCQVLNYWKTGRAEGGFSYVD